MGVPGLWDVLKPTGTVRSLTHIAVKDGFEANPDGIRGFRLGIDVSIWFAHAEYSCNGMNPALRMLFFRCTKLMRTAFLPLFVFDGPERPDLKRGKVIDHTNHKLVPGMKRIVEAFGFDWRMAPGEAEAELAYLNRIGVIDGILSDDVDNFLFGAKMVIRNLSNTLNGNYTNPILNSEGKDDKNHSRVFNMDNIMNHPKTRLTRGGMILIGLMSGGDYHRGLVRCGVATAHALARCGFGDSLFEAATNLTMEYLQIFLVSWREDVREELRTNSKGEIGRKQIALANSITNRFPDIDLLLSYAKPITSESMGRASDYPRMTWEREPDLAKLAGICESYFGWGNEQVIFQRFRSFMWQPIVLRIIRRAALDIDQVESRALVPMTPKKERRAAKNTPCGTPSKMITSHFSSLNIVPTAKVYISGSESDEAEEDQRLIVKVQACREHPSTDGLPEYRLSIAPKQLVQLTESGVKGRIIPGGPLDWADDGGKKGKKAPANPEHHLSFWMPACMVKLVEPRLVEEYEGLHEKKKLKKAGARTKGKAPRETTDAHLRMSNTKKSTTQKRTLSILEDETSGNSDSPQFVAPTPSRRLGQICEQTGQRAFKLPEEDYHPNSLQAIRKGQVQILNRGTERHAGPSNVDNPLAVVEPPAGISLTKKKRISTATTPSAPIRSSLPIPGQSGKTAPLSPSKRKTRERHSSAESDHLSDYIKKSPRKRPKDKPSGTQMGFSSMDIIEISSESDSEWARGVAPYRNRPSISPCLNFIDLT